MRDRICRGAGYPAPRRSRMVCRTFVPGALHQAGVQCRRDRVAVEQVLRDLDGLWPGPAVVLELTGSAGGTWQVGTGEPVATARADAVEYMRTLAGRAGDPALQVVTGDPSARAAVTAARVLF